MKPDCKTLIAGVVLAGGQARRMGGANKCLLNLSGKPVLSHVLKRACPQVGPIILNANGDPSEYSDFCLPVAADVVGGSAGPLAGILTALEWASANAPNCQYVASFPGDSPFFPTDLVEKLYEKIQSGSTMAYASSQQRHHPVFGLWPVNTQNELRDAMITDKIRKVDRWTSRHNLGVVNYPVTTIDPFFNLNTPNDLLKAECHLQKNNVTAPDENY